MKMILYKTFHKTISFLLYVFTKNSIAVLYYKLLCRLHIKYIKIVFSFSILYNRNQKYFEQIFQPVSYTALIY